VALTSVGFDTRGNDGIFGPRSREMIAGWQKKTGASATGFLTAAQRDQLLRTAAPAVARWDEEQRKIEQQKKDENEKKKSEATLAAIMPNAVGSGAPSPPTTGLYASGVTSASSSKAIALSDGTYRGSLLIYVRTLGVEVRMRDGQGTGTVTSSTCGTAPFALIVDPSGNVTGETQFLSATGCTWGPARITGKADDGMLKLAVAGFGNQGGATRGETTLTLGGPAAAATGPAALPSPDGLWRGTYGCLASTIYSNTPSLRDPEFTASLDMRLSNGSGSWKSTGPTPGNGYTNEIRVSVGPSEATVSRFHTGQSYMGGSEAGLIAHFEGNAIRAAGREKGTGRERTFTLVRAQ
jgi:hypothetical protein